MADEDRSFTPTPTEANRARQQGGGVGQEEMDLQRDPNRFQTATNPRQRSFEGDLEGATNADRPTAADFGEEGQDGDGGQAQASPADGSDRDLSDRSGAGMDDVRGDLGAGTPPNVDVHKLGQEDNPQEDWGDPAAEGTMHSSNHTTRGIKTEAERAQGAKTRAHNKDIVSRRT